MMKKYNFLSDFVKDLSLVQVCIAKSIVSIFLLCLKYFMLIYMFDILLKSISSATEFSEFVIVLAMSVLCILLRLVLQYIENNYLNDILKIKLEEIFVKKIFKLISTKEMDDSDGKYNDEYNINFIKTNMFVFVNNICLIVSNIILAVLACFYLLQFSIIYMVVIIFPVLGIIFDVISSKLSVKIAQNETGMLQSIREEKKIINNIDVLNYLNIFSLHDAYINYKNLKFQQSIDINKNNRYKICVLQLLSSFSKVCAVFFLAVFISIKLVDNKLIDALDVVVIINACNLMVGSIAVIVSKMMSCKVLYKEINNIYQVYLQTPILLIDEAINNIIMDDVCYRYENSNQIFKYNFSIGKGDKVVITGNNGCGKTTFLKLLLGYIKPMSGKISINDKVMDEAYRLNSVTTLFEPYPLLNTTLEVYLDDTEKPVNEIISDNKLLFGELNVDINSNMEFGRSFSTGTRQAINLVRIINSPQSLIVLDEPTSKLNNKLAITLIKKVLAKKSTVIISTHDQSIISLFREDKIIKIDKGKK